MTTEAYLSKNARVLIGLKHLKEHGPKSLDDGICINIEEFATIFDVMEVVADWSKDWPKYSGMPRYPVPDPKNPIPNRDRDASRWDAEQLYWMTENHWDGEYGDLRRELLDFLIEVIEDFVETNRED